MKVTYQQLEEFITKVIPECEYNNELLTIAKFCPNIRVTGINQKNFINNSFDSEENLLDVQLVFKKPFPPWTLYWDNEDGLGPTEIRLLVYILNNNFIQISTEKYNIKQEPKAIIKLNRMANLDL